MMVWGKGRTCRDVRSGNLTPHRYLLLIKHDAKWALAGGLVDCPQRKGGRYSSQARQLRTVELWQPSHMRCLTPAMVAKLPAQPLQKPRTPQTP